MLIRTKAAQFRRNAYYCQMLANDAASPADRLCLLTMRKAWLALAENEDWLEGMCGSLRSMDARSTQGTI